jgi:dUTP pyrophosphatase
MKVQILDIYHKLMREHGVPLPRRAKTGDAGIDLRYVEPVPLVLAPGEFKRVRNGIAVEIPHGFEGSVRSRSGLTSEGRVVMSPGTIDSGYRGEIYTVLANFGNEPWEITPGDRIAQLVVSPVATWDLEFVDHLTPSERGTAGFGSTGK